MQPMPDALRLIAPSHFERIAVGSGTVILVRIGENNSGSGGDNTAGSAGDPKIMRRAGGRCGTAFRLRTAAPMAQAPRAALFSPVSEGAALVAAARRR